MEDNLKYIFTKRSYEHFHFWDLVYEWEDVLSKSLGADIKDEPKLFDKVLKGIPNAYSLLTKEHLSLCFQMGSEVMPHKFQLLQKAVRLRAKNIKSVIPCIIDFWETPDEVKVINKIYSKNPIVLISSMEAFDFLRKHGCKLNLVHWALSLPDKYSINTNIIFKKKYDVAIMGRQDPQLDNYLQTYINYHPDLVYAVRKRENGHFNYYTNKSKFIGCADSRDGYFSIMRGAKCGLYATPGITGKDGSNGFNQVTPRFLELIASQCHILARYPDNKDTDYFCLSQFSKSLDTYQKFEESLDKARATSIDTIAYSEYLKKHYTSTRAMQLKKIIESM